ncbi:major facilitator superfamily domain-containing protein [Podospora appendiculata]|uniref:Major facilitator superfamily domain-containing protein n=1 Tax=Podospora appendiculata TaxID=314037 RepID=A0AAE0XL22_9PEZI|nr:major facilitator superfamily domain-containing protein [Podospora appendiculata]
MEESKPALGPGAVSLHESPSSSPGLGGNEEDDDGIIPKGEIDPVYEAKARVLNHAIQEIGMGRYQWKLFVVVGFGWAADNLWPIVMSLIFTPVTNEFHPAQPPLLALSQNIGLLVGALVWGFSCDVSGRKNAFNFTLGITAVFGMTAASSHSFAAIGCFAALWSFGVGGNLPVDSAIFLEFLPPSNQWMLTVLSVDWAFAQVVANLVAWPLLGNFSCQEGAAACTKADNMGWRWFLLAMGGLTMLFFVIRFCCFKIHESPKYLMGKGRDQDAVRVVREVARINGTTSSLTLADLKACEPAGYVHEGNVTSAARRTLQRKLAEVSTDKIHALFATPRLARSTGLITAIWAFVGLAYPLYNSFLPYILATRGTSFGDGSTHLTYRNALIVSSLGIPGAALGAVLVQVPRLGRKGTLALATVLTGVFLYGSTTAASSDALMGWNCAFNFASNIMYAVLYSFTPELFPTPQRGTGNALTASANRIFGIMAPIVAIYGDLRSDVPVYVSGGLFIAAGVLVFALPFESRGKAAM